MLAQFDPRLVVVFPETVGPAARTGSPRRWPRSGRCPGCRCGWTTLAAAQSAQPLASRARPGDLAVVISSGGTTGVPKGSRRDFATYSTNVMVPSPAPRPAAARQRQARLPDPDPGRPDPARRRHRGAARTTTSPPPRWTRSSGADHPPVPGRAAAVRADGPPGRGRAATCPRCGSLTHIGAMAAPVLRRRARTRLGPVIAHTYGASEIGIVSALQPGRARPAVPVRLRGPDPARRRRPVPPRRRRPGPARGRDRGAVAGHGPGLPAPPGGGGRELRRRLVPHRRPRRPRRRGHSCTSWAGPATSVHPAVTPVALQDTLCRRPRSVTPCWWPTPRRGWIAAAEAWPGGAVDAGSAAPRSPTTHGAQVAASLRLDAGGPDPAHRAGQAEPPRHPRRQ